MSKEDTDFARAMALSLGLADPTESQEQADHALALSLQENQTVGSDKPSQEESDHLLAMALMEAEKSEVESEVEEDVQPRRTHKELVQEADRIWAARLQAAEDQQAAAASEQEEGSDSDIADEVKKIEEKYNRELALAIQRQEEEDAAPKICPFAELSLFATANFDTPSQWIHGPRVQSEGSVLQAHLVRIKSESEVEIYFNHLLATSIGVSKASALPNAWRLKNTSKGEDQLWDGAGERLRLLLEMMNAQNVYLLVSLGIREGNRSDCFDQLVEVGEALLKKCGYSRNDSQKRQREVADQGEDKKSSSPEKKMRA